MQVFVINLDRSTDRLHFFKEQAAIANLPFERISAVDGRKLTAEALNESLAEHYEFQPINAGEIGLFMSHKEAWRRLVESGEPHAAVFEDDVVLASSIRNAFDEIDANHLAFDLIKIETTLRSVVCGRDSQHLTSTHSLQTLRTWHGGTAAYVISASCAGRLLEKKAKLADQIDQVLFNPMSKISSTLRILQLNPAAAIQLDILDRDGQAKFGTTLDRHISGGKFIRHGLYTDLRRLFKKQVESSRRRVLARKPENIELVIPFEQACLPAERRSVA